MCGYMGTCQMETVLSLRERKRGEEVSLVHSEAALKGYEGGRNDESEPG